MIEPIDFAALYRSKMVEAARPAFQANPTGSPA